MNPPPGLLKKDQSLLYLVLPAKGRGFDPKANRLGYTKLRMNQVLKPPSLRVVPSEDADSGVGSLLNPARHVSALPGDPHLQFPAERCEVNICLRVPARITNGAHGCTGFASAAQTRRSGVSGLA